MSILSVLKYQVVESKSGHKIPKINNIHLHSTYDPRYEAERFVLENEDLLKNNNKVLLLGLGFAYQRNT
jgi:S-adenosylmethionine synthetase